MSASSAAAGAPEQFSLNDVAFLRDAVRDRGATMKRMTEESPLKIEVIVAAPEQQPILANLLELYAHDFSEFFALELGEDGRFGYERLPSYWTEPQRHPFLVRVDGKLAGFVLVKRGSDVSGDDSVWDVAEFFVVRGYRRRGVGAKVAREVWSRLPGPWEVRVMESNHSAREFWQRAVAEFVGEAISPIRFEKDGQHWHLFSFESERDARHTASSQRTD